MATGTLYLVATPIGNLEDITLRALAVLRAADVIACEDTRHSRKLLTHYQIARPLVSYHRENEAAAAVALLTRLEQGESVALITDAGSPLVSDPGARLVRAAAGAGVKIVPLPGPSAAIAALMVAGFGADGATPAAIAGFLPARPGERRRWLEPWRGFAGVVVMFEAPHRIAATLADLEAVLGGGRELVITRELTKIHEEVRRGTVATLGAGLRGSDATAAPRGEYTLVVGPPLAAAPAAEMSELETELARLGELGEAERKSALKRLARQRGEARSALYRRYQQIRGKLEDSKRG